MPLVNELAFKSASLAIFIFIFICFPSPLFSLALNLCSVARFAVSVCNFMMSRLCYQNCLIGSVRAGGTEIT